MTIDEQAEERAVADWNRRCRLFGQVEYRGRVVKTRSLAVAYPGQVAKVYIDGVEGPVPLSELRIVNEPDQEDATC